MNQVDTSFFNRVQDTFDIGNRMGYRLEIF